MSIHPFVIGTSIVGGLLVFGFGLHDLDVFNRNRAEEDRSIARNRSTYDGTEDDRRYPLKYKPEPFWYLVGGVAGGAIGGGLILLQFRFMSQTKLRGVIMTKDGDVTIRETVDEDGNGEGVYFVQDNRHPHDDR